MHNLGTDRDFLIDLKILFLKTAAFILNILFKYLFPFHLVFVFTISCQSVEISFSRYSWKLMLERVDLLAAFPDRIIFFIYEGHLESS